MLWPTCLKDDFPLLLLLPAWMCSLWNFFFSIGKGFFPQIIKGPPVWHGATSSACWKLACKARKWRHILNLKFIRKQVVLSRTYVLPWFVVHRELAKLSWTPTPTENKWLWIWIACQDSKKACVVLSNIMLLQIISTGIKAMQENIFAFTVQCLCEHLSIISYWQE